MKKYLLVENDGDGDIYIKYFDNLGVLYSYVCHELIYDDDLDIEDFKNYPYSGVEERLEEHGSSWYIFEGEKEIFNLKVGEEDLELALKDGDWDKFTDFCLGVQESKIMKFQLFTESKKDKFPNIQKLDIDGFVVYVGKDAKSNDHLTFNISSDNDLWFHVKGVPGSHVVIRVKENLPIDSVIKKAAELAKKNSKASKDSKVTVVYCQRRFVKKEPGMNDGQVKVDYKNSYEVQV
jgi:hypothetical protein